MAQNFLNVRLVILNDSAENWAKSTKVLLAGELALDTTNGILKVGDGEHIFNELEPLNDPTIMGDDKTIVLDEGSLSLKNWGVQYYKWVEGAEEGSGEHVLQIVDETNPWIAGLEPKVVNTGSGFELAWYEPSSTTIEGVSSIVTTVQTSVTNLTTAIGTAEDAAGTDTVYGAINKIKGENAEIETSLAGKLDLAGGTMSGALVLADGSPAASQAHVATEIASALASAGHLKREIVEALPEISEADANTIYMVKGEGEEAYKEYMLVDGAFEEIGNTSVDLSGYMPRIQEPVAGNFVIQGADGALVNAGIGADAFAPAAHANDAEAHVSPEEREAWNKKLDAAEGMTLVPEADAEKLAGMPLITQIGEGLSLVDGILTGAQEFVLSVATETELGGVKSSAADNSVSVNEDGTMAINRVNMSNIFVAEEDELILDGGNAG